ncbi:MAG: LutB/LldF family L-lactate oxidation iron-sulfur protein [Candidatus Accumulibacter phosphatis]|jgi:L-lactate dehydrogenase complex protein LldF|uniref:LutB/LldF family L-lactate oxidation iron-sulfur protein n=1 Tax=Candidatus Accumulibacter sp. ACC012 TaxID=2823332 RepID=UPI0025BD02D2|nr:LutB/LldF family L-lactate oxidation iron-sulfur protein [Candidatus Accumulibacter sp. ACC012]
MRQQSMFFKARVGTMLADVRLQANLRKAKGKFVDTRAQAVRDYDQERASEGQGDAAFEALRDAGEAIRQRVVGKLDAWLEVFEEKATARGATVLWARDGQEICDLVLDIARQHGVRKVIKSKSMLSEEADLNQALEAAGIQPVETDLGEYILQIAGNEPPSHIIAPVMHKNVDQVADLFARTHGTPRKTDIPALTREAREVLREHFVSAEMGISGANFLIAETGSAALVTNEGNGRMVTTLPKVHVVITGIEKIVPTLDDFATLMRLLPRSATGQVISNYVSLLTGNKRSSPAGEDANDGDGPETMVFILVDNGRVGLLGTEFQSMLSCIRCGACLNHCPVYQTVGGHAYGWVYPGPMGSVLTPLFGGIDKALDLPQASTLCQQCSVVCPVRIPLPGLLRQLRQRQTRAGLRPRSERLGLRLWAWLAARPALYALSARIAVRYLNWLAAGREHIEVLPIAPSWSAARDLPAPQGRTFHELYRQQRRGK